MFGLYATRWTEYERGWGQRPDGITLFEDRETGTKHIEQFFADRKAAGDRVPDDYSNPSELFFVEVSENLYNEVMSVGSKWLPQTQSNSLTTWT